ncbi:MAG: hypothetical protein PHN82_04000 [bacterium]|nr:hypothetical protein [bacterium]
MALRIAEKRRALIIFALFFVAAAHTDFVNFIERRDKEQVIPFLQWSDEAFYYSFAHSLAFDGDVDLTNQFRFITYGPIGHIMNILFYGDYFIEPDMPMRSKVGIGTAILTLPFILAARAAASVYESLGGPAVNRFAAVYLWAYKMGMLFWAFAGIGAGYALLRRIGRTPGVAAASVAAAMLGLSIGYYVIFQNAWTHIICFGWVTLHLLACARWHEDLKEAPPSPFRPLAPLLVGLSGGLCLSIRFNNLLLIPVPLIICMHEAMRRARGGAGTGRERRRRALASLCIIGAGYAAGFLPQMLVWRSMYGEWLVDTYGRFGERLSVLPWYFFHILLSPRCGLFVWTPLAALASAGMILGIGREGRASPWPWICSYILLAHVWFSGCFPGWHMGQSFGARYQSDYTFVFMYGFSVVFMRARRGRIAQAALRAAVAILILWNFYLMMAFRAYVIGAPAMHLVQKPFRLEPLIVERRRVWDCFRKEIALVLDVGLHTDYRRRYPLMTPADLGLPTPEEHERLFDPADEAGSVARWRRMCVEHSERIMNPAG